MMYDLVRFTQERLSVTFGTYEEIKDFIHKCVGFGILDADKEESFVSILSDEDDEDSNSVVYGWTFKDDEPPEDRILYGYNYYHNEWGWEHITAKELLIETISLPSELELMNFLGE